jgi:predicted esterase
MHREELGGLNYYVARVREDESPPAAAAIFCHGFGAPGTDLVPLASVLASRLGVHFPRGAAVARQRRDPRRPCVVAD